MIPTNKAALLQGWHSLGAGCSELVPRVSWVNPRTPKGRGGILGTSSWTLRAPYCASHCPDHQGNHEVGARETSPSMPKSTHHLPRLAVRSSSQTEPGLLPAPSRVSTPHSSSPAALRPAPDSAALGPVRRSPRASPGAPLGSCNLAAGPDIQKATQSAQMALPGWHLECSLAPRHLSQSHWKGSSYRTFL